MADMHADEPEFDRSTIIDAEDFRRRVRATGGKMTDGPCEDDWTEGWAVHAFLGQRAHWWIRTPAPKNATGRVLRITFAVRSLCGRIAFESEAAGLLHQGNIARCAHCIPKARKRLH